MIDFAYTRYEIQTLDPETVVLYTETNDNLDYGYPTEFAKWSDTYTGPDALAKAKRHTGVSRQGVGHRVYVTLDGETI